MLLAGLAAHPAPAGERLVVVELFTSQGCSSCPPADALLAALAEKPGVLALAFHVDYWDRLGWKDPFSTPLATRRQRSYGDQFRLRAIYTPQIVVDGRSEMVGSDRTAVTRAIAAAAPPAAAADASIVRTPDGVAVKVAASAEAGALRVQLVGFVRGHVTRVTAGENAGRTLADSNIVVSLDTLGDEPGEWNLRADASTNYAVLVQARDGRMLGAAVLMR
jgi:hypothetical protein